MFLIDSCGKKFIFDPVWENQQWATVDQCMKLERLPFSLY